jgi:hypothetical protein
LLLHQLYAAHGKLTINTTALLLLLLLLKLRHLPYVETVLHSPLQCCCCFCHC